MMGGAAVSLTARGNHFLGFRTMVIRGRGGSRKSERVWKVRVRRSRVTILLMRMISLREGVRRRQARIIER